jgi:toxin-antitoxin system PIN domain toxin
VIIPDASLLLYAYDEASPFHGKAAGWWSDLLSGSEPIGLVPAVLFAFIRVGTSPRVFENPLSIAEASHHVRTWLDVPVVELLDIEKADVGQALAWLTDAGAGGNLTTDAQIAAIARRHQAVVHTADTDFARFPGVRWKNPLL